MCTGYAHDLFDRTQRQRERGHGREKGVRSGFGRGQRERRGSGQVSSKPDLTPFSALSLPFSALARVAESTQAAFLLIRHLAKSTLGKAACYRGLASMAILGAMRTAFL